MAGVVMTDVKPIQPAAYSTSSFVNERKQTLFSATWLPFEGEAKAILLWHVGLGEHSSRYEHVLAAFAAAGVAVYSYDPFGHGRSDPKHPSLRCYIPDYKLMVNDYLFRLQQIKDEYAKANKPLPPVFAGGQSMGGMIAALSVAQKQSDFAGLVLHSPLIDVEWTLTLRIQASVGSLLAALFPKAALVPAVRPEDMSQDPKIVKEYLEDKLNYVGKTKCRTAHECLKAMRSLDKLAASISLPVYIAHGSGDRCTSNAASKRFFQKISSKDKTYNMVEGGYHELLFGPEKADCVHKLVAWFTEHISKSPPSSSAAATSAVAADTSASASESVGPGAQSTAEIMATAKAITDQTSEIMKDLKSGNAPTAAATPATK